jgi:hypothetical protein
LYIVQIRRFGLKVSVQRRRERGKGGEKKKESEKKKE